jgi:hypothetical protein
VCPDTGAADNVATSGIPVNIGDTIVLSGLHELEVGGEILLGLNLLTLEVHIPEVHIEAGLGVDGCDNNETTLGGPVDTVAGLLIDSAHQLEVTGCVTLLLRCEERDGSLRANGGALWCLAVCDSNESGSIGLPGKVNDGILQAVNNLNGNTLLANAENLQVGGHGLLGLGVTVDLDADVGTLGLPVQLDIGNVEQVTGTDNLL